MKKNVKIVNLNLTEQGLQKFKTVPTFRNLLFDNQLSVLKTGNNILKVNHFVYGSLLRLVSNDKENMSINTF